MTDDVSESIRLLMEKAREFGEDREKQFREAMDLLNNLFGGGKDNDESA